MRLPGRKIEELNLSCMTGKFILFFLCFAPQLWGAPPHESLALQEMRSSFQEMNYRFNSCQTELQLLLERFADLETRVKNLSKTDPSAARIAKLEATQKTLAEDFKTLKSHLDKTNESLHQCQKQLASLDKQLNTDIASLKNSLKSMITLLKGGGAANSEESYVVKAGDSLGQIAIDHRTTTKRLKEVNQLKSDTIFPGQKLIIP